MSDETKHGLAVWGTALGVAIGIAVVYRLTGINPHGAIGVLLLTGVAIGAALWASARVESSWKEREDMQRREALAQREREESNAAPEPATSPLAVDPFPAPEAGPPDEDMLIVVAPEEETKDYLTQFLDS